MSLGLCFILNPSLTGKGRRVASGLGSYFPTGSTKVIGTALKFTRCRIITGKFAITFGQGLSEWNIDVYSLPFPLEP